MPTLRNYNHRIVFSFAILVLLILDGCRSLPSPSEEVERRAEIEQFFKQWQGTAYGYGGSSKNAVDCSALMVHAYRDLYAINLPRTTDEQADWGNRIRQKNLRAGDLVFFKTGFRTRHVGIYVGNGEFVHSSRSRGVMKSSLTTKYWSDHYWKAKRIVSF